MAVMMWLPSRAHAIRRTPNRTLTALSNRPDHGLWCARRWRGSADDGESAGPERGRGCGAGGILEPERALPPRTIQATRRTHPGDPANTPDPPGRPSQHAGPTRTTQPTRRTHPDGPANTPDPPGRPSQHAGSTRTAQPTRRTHQDGPANTPDPLDGFGQSGGLPLVVGTERLPFGAALPGPQTRRRDRRADRAIGRIDALVDEEHQTLPAGYVDLPHGARR